MRLKKDVVPARCACTTAHGRDFEEPLAIDGQMPSCRRRPPARRHAPRCRSRREKTTCRPPGAKLSRPAPPRVGVARRIDIVVIAGCGSSPVGTARSARRCRRSGSERRSAEQFDDAGGEQRPAYRLAGRARPGDVLVPLLEPAFCVAAGYDAPARDFGHTTSHAFASHPGRDGVSTRANIKRPMVVRGKLFTHSGQNNHQYDRPAWQMQP